MLDVEGAVVIIFAARYWKLIGVGLIVVLALAWVARIDHLRAHYKAALSVLAEQAQTVVLAVRTASDNPKADWSTAPGQIIALGESNRRLKGAIEEQNLAIDEMAAEAVRLKARASELKSIADKAEAQRQSALRRLSDMSITPGTRNDCMQLLKEAEDALDLVRSAGA